MPFTLVLDSIEDLPEIVQAEYEQRDDGKFYLQTTPAEGFEVTQPEKLMKALSTERENVKKLRSQVGKFEGIDPDRARSALEKLEEFENWDPDQQVQERVAAREKKLLEQHSKELKQQEERSVRLKEQLEKTLVTEAATKAIADNKGSIDLLLPLIQAQTRLVQNEDGAYRVEVIDPLDNTARPTSTGESMSIDDLVKEMRGSDRYSRAFDGSGQSGGGTPPKDKGRNPVLPTKNGIRQIRSDDQEAIDSSVEDIAAGKAVIVDPPVMV
tara:strand:+ start:4461 stop:5267 length:807 start_codon:yes stop_codon:yes gene_type:complete